MNKADNYFSVPDVHNYTLDGIRDFVGDVSCKEGRVETSEIEFVDPEHNPEQSLRTEHKNLPASEPANP